MHTEYERVTSSLPYKETGCHVNDATFKRFRGEAKVLCKTMAKKSKQTKAKTKQNSAVGSLSNHDGNAKENVTLERFHNLLNFSAIFPIRLICLM